MNIELITKSQFTGLEIGNAQMTPHGEVGTIRDINYDSLVLISRKHPGGETVKERNNVSVTRARLFHLNFSQHPGWKNLLFMKIEERAVYVVIGDNKISLSNQENNMFEKSEMNNVGVVYSLHEIQNYIALITKGKSKAIWDPFSFSVI